MERTRDVVFFTAANAPYFRMCLGLVLSMLRAAPDRPRIRILDLGLSPEQVETLKSLVEAVLPPTWHAKSGVATPPWYRGFTARPYLPRYVEDASIIAWIDADAWVQEWSAVETMIEAARSGAMAIVEVGGGPGVEIKYRRPDGVADVFAIRPDDVRRTVTECYRICFGEEAALKYGGMRNFSGGVWALRRDSPSWAVYGELIEQGLSRSAHPFAEQQALNIAIRTGRIPVTPQPETCNYNMNQELPAFDTERNRFVSPQPPHETIGILHFTDLKLFSTLSLRRIPGEGEIQVPFHFLDWVSSVALK